MSASTSHTEADTGARRAKPLTRRKRALLEAAVKCFRASGYRATTINDIGAAAGVTGPALYAHFKSKEAVLEAAVWEMARAINLETTAAMERGNSATERLSLMVQALISVALEHRDFAAVYLFEARYLPSEVYGAMLRSEERFRDYWFDALRDARPEISEVRARTIVRSAVHMALHSCLQDPELDPTQLHALLARMTLAALYEGNVQEESGVLSPNSLVTV